MRGKRKIGLLVLTLLVFAAPLTAQVQVGDVGGYDDMLNIEVDNLNPVYKPVMGVGYGVFSYLGDVRNTNTSPLLGTYGYKVNVSTFLDNKQYIRANFFFIGGKLSGAERSYPDPMRNMNFESDILLFGINLNYDFDNLYKTYRRVHPYISVGIETLTFNSKIDSFHTTSEGIQEQYFYWPDGTIRNQPNTPAGREDPTLSYIQRDYIYETNLRDEDWGLGNYPQYSFAIPVDLGLDFWISNRLLFRLGTTYHITFTDNIDHVSAENTSGVVGNSWNDDFMYTYASLHLDLFSDKKTLLVQKLFADIDLDLTLIGDEDNDGTWDGWDQCPETPFAVQTDTTGCPLDDDFDGIPNYQDDEPNSRYGAFVDSRGVEMTEDDLIAMLDMSAAVDRRDVELYLRTPSSYSKYQNITADEIPDKFMTVDGDGDGYISFDEILDEIDEFFDFDSELNSEDIYELNNFFFAQ